MVTRCLYCDLSSFLPGSHAQDAPHVLPVAQAVLQLPTWSHPPWETQHGTNHWIHEVGPMIHATPVCCCSRLHEWVLRACVGVQHLWGQLIILVPKHAVPRHIWSVQSLAELGNPHRLHPIYQQSTECSQISSAMFLQIHFFKPSCEHVTASILRWLLQSSVEACQEFFAPHEVVWAGGKLGRNNDWTMSVMSLWNRSSGRNQPKLASPRPKDVDFTSLGRSDLRQRNTPEESFGT